MLGQLALLSVILTGCHGGAKTDIVERELRWQEDQIYAMEDYLSQYQQLLCDCRQENAALRRQLAQPMAAPPAARDREERPAPWSPERPEGPAIGAPRQSTPTEIKPEEPEVPPLDQTSQQRIHLWEASPTPISRRLNGDRPSATESPPTVESAADSEPQFVVTSDEEPVAQRQDLPVDQPPEHVWLYGEVISGDHEGGGPRLLVDVEPLAAAGRPARFVGTLSLMILDLDHQRRARSLARWDFTPDDLQQAASEVSGGRAMRFRLQLPPDVPVERPVELWIRLLSDDGSRLLAHTELDLRQPGQFSSIGGPAPTSAEQQAMYESDNDLLVEHPLAGAQRPSGDRWQIARPGESTAFQQRLGRPEGKWKVATEPVPTVVRQSSAALPDPDPRPPLAKRAASPAPDAVEVAPPRWSPDRASGPSALPNDADSDDRPARLALPSWSPSR